MPSIKACHIYTGELESRNSGSNLCISMPQKGHKGFGHPRRIKCSDKYLTSCNDDRWKNMSGACLIAHLSQQMQNHRGIAGQTCIETAQRWSL